MKYTVTAYMNVSEDNFMGYHHDDNLATAGDLALVVEATSWEGAADTAYMVGNRMMNDVNGRSWPSDVRSLSVGDVVCVKVWADAHNAIPRYASVESVGFVEVPQPTHTVDLPGTKATSRKPYIHLAARQAHAWKGKEYADYIERAQTEHAADPYQSLGEALRGNDGD